jgi:hypothetical protein
MPRFTKLCFVAAALTSAVTCGTPLLASPPCDDSDLQQQVAEFNQLAAKCEKAALQESDYVMRLWHWKACMWDFGAPRFTADLILAAREKGLRLYEPRL